MGLENQRGHGAESTLPNIPISDQLERPNLIFRSSGKVLGLPESIYDFSFTHLVSGGFLEGFWKDFDSILLGFWQDSGGIGRDLQKFLGNHGNSGPGFKITRYCVDLR